MVKARGSFCGNYYNVVSFVHIPPSAVIARPKRIGAMCHMATAGLEPVCRRPVCRIQFVEKRGGHKLQSKE